MSSRLDVALVARGLVASRSAARRAILAGDVVVAGVEDPKPATVVNPHDVITIADVVNQFVSRGGAKLAAALDRFDIDVVGRRAIDVGSSTGGFTDCLLQRGAATVVSLDVGTDQLHASLRADPRVRVMEQCDVRRAGQELDGCCDLVVVDLSFVSLTAVAPHVVRLGTNDADWIALVKPQFEVGPDGRNRHGVVVEAARRASAVAAAIEAVEAAGLVMCGFSSSPLLGGAGNREYLAWLRRGSVLARVTHPDDDGADD